MEDEFLYELAARLGERLIKKQMRCVVAESCTGGLLSSIITAIPGCSQWFERGFVTYSNESKQELLGVSKEILKSHGAVSEATVRAMVSGALHNSHADISVAITGIAGPGGASKDKPLGTVWIAWAGTQQSIKVHCYHFTGDRIAVRNQAVAKSLDGLLKMVA